MSSGSLWDADKGAQEGDVTVTPFHSHPQSSLLWRPSGPAPGVRSPGLGSLQHRAVGVADAVPAAERALPALYRALITECKCSWMKVTTLG